MTSHPKIAAAVIILTLLTLHFSLLHSLLAAALVIGFFHARRKYNLRLRISRKQASISIRTESLGQKMLALDYGITADQSGKRTMLITLFYYNGLSEKGDQAIFQTTIAMPGTKQTSDAA